MSHKLLDNLHNDGRDSKKAAIVLSLLDGRRTTVYSNSRSTVSAFTKGPISESALRILRCKEIKQHPIVRFPTPSRQIENAPYNLVSAHTAVRGLVECTAAKWCTADAIDNRYPWTAHNELRKNFYQGSWKYPLPHCKLNRYWHSYSCRCGISWPLHTIYSVEHMCASIRLCELRPHAVHYVISWKRHYAVQVSWCALPFDLEAQLWAVQKVCDLMEWLSPPVPTWE